MNFQILIFINLEHSYGDLPISVLFVHPYSNATNRVGMTVVFAATIHVNYWIATAVYITL